MKPVILRYFLIIFLFLPVFIYSQPIYSCYNGIAQFNSIASQELIKATSKKLSGAINTADKNFAFVVDISSFEGFNSDLQREHFNEKYLETNKYSAAEFTGKIIEDIDFTKEGTKTVRAKGILKIHNIEQERIIKGTVKIMKDRISVKSDFNVILNDHDIKVPKVVHEKIASEINVSISADLFPAKEKTQ